MHAAEREIAILDMLSERGFVSFREIEQRLQASAATLRRDLERLASKGRIERVHGGATLVGGPLDLSPQESTKLRGIPLRDNLARNARQKQAIGRAAAALCCPGEAVIIDGGSTTLQMCPHLEGQGLQVLTNSLPIVNALIGQPQTRLLVPGGAIFREQNIILSPGGDDLLPRFHALKLFMGAASIGPQGVMQVDIVLVAAEREFMQRADQLILLVDSSKFQGPSGSVVCELGNVHTVISDDGIEQQHRDMLHSAGVRLIIA